MKKLSEDKAQQIFRDASTEEVEEFVRIFNKYADTFGFKTDFHVNAFLAQVHEEVGHTLTPRRENLNYSCKALKSLFKYYKNHPKEAKEDGRCDGHRANQRNIANKAYGNRLGNVRHNDGWIFRGAGYIQLTGRENYDSIATAISLAIGEPITAEDLSLQMEHVDGALLSAMAFFLTHKLYKAKTVDEMTEKVNKYTQSYGQRKKHYKFIASL